jgi:hypothetical protein
MKRGARERPFLAADGPGFVASDQVGSCVAFSTGSGDWSGKYCL